jgi:hypothetical protein
MVTFPLWPFFLCALFTVAWMGSRGGLKMVVAEKFLHLVRMGLVITTVMSKLRA